MHIFVVVLIFVHPAVIMMVGEGGQLVDVQLLKNPPKELVVQPTSVVNEHDPYEQHGPLHVVACAPDPVDIMEVEYEATYDPIKNVMIIKVFIFQII